MEPTGKTSEEVKVPKLAKNRQNWKIYHTKIIEATATDITDPLGVLAGWQPDDGSYNWECLDAILKWTFYTSVPITILRPIRKLDTTHEIFNYLVKHFCNNNPIMDPRTKKSEPSANKVDGAGTAAEDISADSEKQKGSPTSESAVGYKHCCGIFTTLHKRKAHYSRVCSTLVPSVACETTEGEYLLLTIFHTY